MRDHHVYRTDDLELIGRVEKAFDDITVWRQNVEKFAQGALGREPVVLTSFGGGYSLAGFSIKDEEKVGRWTDRAHWKGTPWKLENEPVYHLKWRANKQGKTITDKIHKAGLSTRMDDPREALADCGLPMLYGMLQRPGMALLGGWLWLHYGEEDPADTTWWEKGVPPQWEAVAYSDFVKAQEQERKDKSDE